MFNSKYPIVAVGMNTVSDVNLALAVSKAGAVPSLSSFNYYLGNDLIDLATLKKDLEYYQRHNQVCDLIFSTSDITLIKNYQLFDFFKEFDIKFLEIIATNLLTSSGKLAVIRLLTKIKQENRKVFLKLLKISDSTKLLLDAFIKKSLIDGIILKGPNGAGRVANNSSSLEELTRVWSDIFSEIGIIPCGGVGSKEDVKNLISHGATAVGVGTLFAASEESCLSVEAKQRLIKSNSSDISTLNTYDFDQNSLVFSNEGRSLNNNTVGLKKGIITGNAGHIFVGKGIDQIDKIRSVKDIVEDLCSLL
jgi:NAD(P)H-dependent flavin oxidoreductase YrpB (nitropropane dioxygenase family)